MVGDTALLSAIERHERQPPGELVLSLAGVELPWSEEGRSLHSIDLHVCRHEILGVAGVAGNGQRELARVCAGLDKPVSGRSSARRGRVRRGR